MNQKRVSMMIRVVFLALVATGTFTSLLSAGDYTGSFTLPLETQWGAATLPPGDYTFKLNMDVSPYTVRVYGKNATAFVFPASVSDDTASGQSELIVVRRGKQGIVRAMRLPQERMVFKYALPQGQHEWLLAEGPQLIQRLPIVISRKSTS